MRVRFLTFLEDFFFPDIIQPDSLWDESILFFIYFGRFFPTGRFEGRKEGSTVGRRFEGSKEGRKEGRFDGRKKVRG